jgi:hypothetical protein
VHAIIRAAAEVQAVIGAEGGSSIEGAGIASVSVPAARMSDAERLQLGNLLENMQACWMRDRSSTRNAVTTLLARMDRHHREWRFDDPFELRLCVGFLDDCRVAPGELQIVLRRRSQAAVIPTWALAALGPYVASSVKIGRPDTLSSDAALERWVSIRLVDRRGDGIPNVAARALFGAWLNIAKAGPSARDTLISPD